MWGRLCSVHHDNFFFGKFSDGKIKHIESEKQQTMPSWVKPKRCIVQIVYTDTSIKNLKSIHDNNMRKQVVTKVLNFRT